MGLIYGSEIVAWYTRINNIRKKRGMGSIGSVNPTGSIALASHINAVIAQVNACYNDGYLAYADRPGAMASVSVGQIIQQLTANDINARLTALERVCVNYVNHGTQASRPSYATTTYRVDRCSNYSTRACKTNNTGNSTNNTGNATNNTGNATCPKNSNNSNCATRNTHRGGSNFTNTTACSRCSNCSTNYTSNSNCATSNSNCATGNSNCATGNGNCRTSNGNCRTGNSNCKTNNYTHVYDYAVRSG